MKRKLVHLTVLCWALLVAGGVSGQDRRGGTRPTPVAAPHVDEMVVPSARLENGYELDAGAAWDGASAIASDAAEVEGGYAPGPCMPAGRCCGGCGCRPCQPRCCGTCSDCCECCDCCCPPCWTVRGAAVYLWRSDPDSLTFITQPNGTDAFNFDQFSFDPELGVDASAIRDLGCGRSLEARYLGLWDVEDTVAVGPFPGGNVFYNTTPPTPANFGTGGVTFTNNFQSDLHSGEINYRCRPRCWLTVFAGARYLNLREEFAADFDFIGVPTQDVLITSRAQNDLYGAQLGAEVAFLDNPCRRCRIQGLVKAGAYYLHAEHDLSTVTTGFGTADVNAQGSASDDDVAFVGEAGLTLSYQLRPCLALQLGYQVLWLEGVALGTEQIAASGNIFQAAAGVDTDGSVFYHGARAGLEFRF